MNKLQRAAVVKAAEEATHIHLPDHASWMELKEITKTQLIIAGFDKDVGDINLRINIDDIDIATTRFEKREPVVIDTVHPDLRAMLNALSHVQYRFNDLYQHDRVDNGPIYEQEFANMDQLLWLPFHREPTAGAFDAVNRFESIGCDRATASLIVFLHDVLKRENPTIYRAVPIDGSVSKIDHNRPAGYWLHVFVAVNGIVSGLRQSIDKQTIQQRTT